MRTIELSSAGSAVRPSELKAAERTPSTLVGCASAGAWSATAVAAHSLRWAARLYRAEGAELPWLRGCKHSRSRVTRSCNPHLAPAQRMPRVTALARGSGGASRCNVAVFKLLRIAALRHFHVPSTEAWTVAWVHLDPTLSSRSGGVSITPVTCISLWDPGSARQCFCTSPIAAIPSI